MVALPFIKHAECTTCPQRKLARNASRNNNYDTHFFAGADFFTYYTYCISRAARARCPSRRSYSCSLLAAITYAAYLQRPAALDALISECSKNIAVDACYQHAPFAGWRAFHFAKADRDSPLIFQTSSSGSESVISGGTSMVFTARRVRLGSGAT
jgi:hypothetical protein